MSWLIPKPEMFWCDVNFLYPFSCAYVCVCQNNHLQWKRVSAHRCWRCNAIKLMMCLICTQNLSMCSEISRPIQMPTSIGKTLEDVCLLSVYWRFTHVIDVSYTTCTQRIRHGYDVAWAAPTLIYVHMCWCVIGQSGHWIVSSHLIVLNIAVCTYA